MGKSRACNNDIFQLNDYIDDYKKIFLYQPYSTECQPRDPFNNWYNIIDSIINLYIDIKDNLNNEIVELEINDSFDSDNYITDQWENIILNLDIIDSDDYIIDFNDFDDYIFEDFIISDIVDIENNILMDFIDFDDYIIDFNDSDYTSNILEDSFLELNFDILDNQNYDLEFIIENEDLWDFNIIDE